MRARLDTGSFMGGNEKPRHVVREAGLVITSDLCPVTPGSSTRSSTSLQSIRLSATWPVGDQLARARLSKSCPRDLARAEVTLGWCHGSSARC